MILFLWLFGCREAVSNFDAARCFEVCLNGGAKYEGAHMFGGGIFETNTEYLHCTCYLGAPKPGG